MKPAWRKKLEGKAGEWLIRRIQAVALRKSPEQAEMFGKKLGRLIFKVAKSRRDRAYKNIGLAFPQLTAAERLSLTKGCFEHFALISVDFLRSKTRTDQELLDSTEIVGLEHLQSAVSKGKGALVLTGHMGNWERMTGIFPLLGFKLAVVARDADDQGVQGMLKEARSSSGAEVLSRGNAAREMLKVLRRGDLVGLLADQNADDIFIPFFGHPAGTVLGPGTISKRTGAPVVPFVMIRTGPNQYRLELSPSLTPDPNFEFEEGTMRAYHQFLEQAIAKTPEQYLWFHDRWRNARKKGLM